MELYFHPLSPASQKVRLTLAEKSLDWELKSVDLANKENLEPWYLALNPLGVLPTLVDDRLHYAAGALVWPVPMRPALLEKTEEERDAILARLPRSSLENIREIGDGSSELLAVALSRSPGSSPKHH